jgi:hypothetical protein
VANPYRGQVELRLEGENEEVTLYKLWYDGNALVEIEEAMGMPINTLIKDHIELMDGFKFKRVALFHGLQRDPRGKKLSLKDCGQMVASPQAKEISHAVIRGVFLAMGVDLDKHLAAHEAEEADGPKDGEPEDPLEPAV